MLKKNMSVNRIGEQHEPLSALIKNQIRQRIIDGEFLPGERLIEHKLSEEMAVSRIPIREALRILAAEGLVTIEPHRGAFVATLSREDALHMVEVRAALEGLNAKLAAQNIKDADIKKLKKILEKGTQAIEREDLEACKKLNREFHSTLATIPGNTILMELITSLRERTAIVFTANTILKVRENWLEHEQILRAVIAGNAELAALLATQHVYNAAKAASEELEKQEEESA